MLNWLNAIDQALMIFFNRTISNPVFDFLMPIITEQDNWIIPILVTIILLAWKGGKKGRIALVAVLITIAITDVVAAQIIKPLVGRLRPSRAIPEMINLLVGRGGKYGFVSNHAANTFALATVFGYFYPKTKSWLFPFATLIAFSRVYVGVHYPGDVIFGGLFGYGAAWLVLTGVVLVRIRELKRGRTWVDWSGNG